jgi:hypothetical protein
MEVYIQDTLLKVYETGDIERYNKKKKCWTKVLATPTGQGYVSVFIDKRIYFVHRIVYWVYGEVIIDLEDGEVMIDHIDRNKSNNHKDNLRIATPFLNALNCDRVEQCDGYRKKKDGFEVHFRMKNYRYTRYFKKEYDAVIHSNFMRQQRYKILG